MSAFLTIAVIHMLALMSPGPDFAIIVKQSLSQPRRIVLWTALGVALGILVHVAYSLLGLGLIISQSIVLFSIIKLIGAAYLVFIGWKSLTAKAPAHDQEENRRAASVMSVPQAMRIGFLCNALNPKVTIFFLALFTQVIDPQTPLVVQLLYGLFMSAQTFFWFSTLASVLTLRPIRSCLDLIHLWAERVMGAVLIALGIKVALSTQR
ncbi:MAG: LysE family transporter [Candidatus Peribacteraceae bacterium]|nr:LysE family transporter [Candidatus Peribacteraceae bacterium]